MTPILKTTRGVALLISLSVIMLLSIGLTKTFEKKAVETAHLKNTLSRFQAETMARSAFRTIAMAIKEKGLVFVIKNVKVLRKYPIPLPNGEFFIDEVKSLDHLFYLNREFEENDPRTNMLANIVNFIRAKQEPMEPEVIVMDIAPLISAVNDWIDPDDHPDEAYLNDRESYQDEKPEFEIKNREFERLSEIRLLPDFRELGLPLGYIERHFRVIGKLTADYKTGATEHIDVNAANEEEMNEFLARFKDTPPYEKVYGTNSPNEYLMEVIFEKDEDSSDNNRNETMSEFGIPNFVNAQTRFSTKKELDEQMKSALALSGTNELKVLELFAVKTDYLAVNYRVTVDKTTLRINCVVQLSYHRNSLDIDKFKILKFKIVR